MDSRIEDGKLILIPESWDDRLHLRKMFRGRYMQIVVTKEHDDKRHIKSVLIQRDHRY